MATITKTMKQDAADSINGLMTDIRKATTRAEADRALGGVLALANYSQVWSLITPEDADWVRDCARRAFATSVAFMYAEGIYVIGFCFPVVPQGQARIRVQISADHEQEHLDKAISAFTKVGAKYGILGKKKDEIAALYGA